MFPRNIFVFSVNPESIFRKFATLVIIYNKNFLPRIIRTIIFGYLAGANASFYLNLENLENIFRNMATLVIIFKKNVFCLEFLELLFRYLAGANASFFYLSLSSLLHGNFL
jgi:hypothetical protein